METGEVEGQTEEAAPVSCPICQGRDLFFVGKVTDKALPAEAGAIEQTDEARPRYQGYRWDAFICLQCNYVGYLLPREDLARLQEWAGEGQKSEIGKQESENRDKVQRDGVTG